VSVNHYENFPVASWLCPAALRPPITAIYHFARTADDMADEGNASFETRLNELRQYRADLDSIYTGAASSAGWLWVFEPLRRAVRQHQLPLPLLTALLDAFEQDVQNPGYQDRHALLAYCARSANPIGRLLLHLYKQDEPKQLAQSDAICSALQLINFWQDLSVDLPRKRFYVPQQDAQHHGLDAFKLPTGDTAATRALVKDLCQWARTLMLEGAPLAWNLPGRIGWELRLVVHGGLRILEKIAAMENASITTRPRLRSADFVLVGTRALGRCPRAQSR
jgi:hydroxysqualene synthase